MSRTSFLPLALALLILTLGAYQPLGKNSFIDFDDEQYITANPHVLAGLNPAGFRWAWTNVDANYWLPVTWLSLQLDAQLFSKRGPDGRWQLSAAAVHWHNLAWHMAGVVLLFHLGQRLTGARWRSFLVAALFAVHPMHVESVAWAVERKDVLSVFFGLLTLLLYLRYLEEPRRGRTLAMVAAYAVSLLAKPMLTTLPFVLLLLDYWPLCRLWPAPTTEPARPAASLSRLVREKLPLFALAAGVGIVTLVLRQQTGAALSLERVPLSARMGNALASYGAYLRSTFYPLHLAVLYPHPGRDWSRAAAGLGLALVLGISLFCLVQVRRRRWLVVGWLWFVGTLVPVIGLVQGGDQAWADRFSYWPHIGLFTALVWGLAELADRLRVGLWARGAAALLILGGLSVLTWAQVGLWRNSEVLWHQALAVTPDNDRAHACLGKYYQDQGRPDRAVLHLGQAVQIKPNVVDYHYNLGVPLLLLGRLDEAAQEFRAAASLAPRNADAWYNLGMVRLRQGRAETALRCFQKVRELQPESADALAGMGQALVQQGQLERAARLCRAALEHQPGTADAWHALGRAYLAQGRPDRARDALERAVGQNPQLIAARSELGLALGRHGRWTEAAACQEQAVRMQIQREEILQELKGRPIPLDGLPPLLVYRCRLAYALGQLGSSEAAWQIYLAELQKDPHWPEKLTDRACRLLLSPSRRDPQLACELVSQAVQAVGAPSARMLTVLALAQAACGHYPQAWQSVRQALGKSLRSGPASSVKSGRDLLSFWQGAWLFPACYGAPAWPSVSSTPIVPASACACAAGA